MLRVLREAGILRPRMKRPAPTPRKDKPTICFRMPPPMLARLEAMQTKSKRTRTSLLLDAFEIGLKRLEKEAA